MDRLIEVVKTNSDKFMPETPDVPRHRIDPNTVYNVELTTMQIIASNTTGPTFGAIAFQLSNFPQSTYYATVFDQYRIREVNVKFVPTATSVLTPVMGSGSYLLTVLDYDDASTPTNMNSLVAYSSLKITPPGVIDERTLRPRIAMAAYGSSGTFTSSANIDPLVWVDAGSATVQYYGLKYGLSSSPAVESITVFTTCWVQFRAERST